MSRGRECRSSLGGFSSGTLVRSQSGVKPGWLAPQGSAEIENIRPGQYVAFGRPWRSPSNLTHMGPLTLQLAAARVSKPRVKRRAKMEAILLFIRRQPLVDLPSLESRALHQGMITRRWGSPGNSLKVAHHANLALPSARWPKWNQSEHFLGIFEID